MFLIHRWQHKLWRLKHIGICYRSVFDKSITFWRRRREIFFKMKYDVEHMKLRGTGSSISTSSFKKIPSEFCVFHSNESYLWIFISETIHQLSPFFYYYSFTFEGLMRSRNSNVKNLDTLASSNSRVWQINLKVNLV